MASMPQVTEKNGQMVRRLLCNFEPAPASTSADTLDPDLHDIEMFIVILWQPEDAIHDGFLDWLRTEFMPGVLESPEALRSSIYKLQPESLAQNAGTDTQDTSTMKPYMTIWEFDCEELPWEVLIFLARKEGWRCYVEGGQVQWQIAMYLVDRVYPK
jgi:hypothetical protein